MKTFSSPFKNIYLTLVMNRELTLLNLKRVMLLFKIERSEQIIEDHKFTANKRNLNQAIIELLKIKTDYNQRYGFN